MKIGDNVYVIINGTGIPGSLAVEKAVLVEIKHSVNMVYYVVELDNTKKRISVSKPRIFKSEMEVIKSLHK